MIKSLRKRAELATQEIQKIIGTPGCDHPKEIENAIERTIISALLEERHRCAEVASALEHDQDKAHKISNEIRRVNTALVVNLSSMR